MTEKRKTWSDRLRVVAEDGQEKAIAERIYLSLWKNPGYLPDPVADAFRNAMVKTAMEICHECGTEDATVEFCAEAIAEWIRLDAPNTKTAARQAEAHIPSEGKTVTATQISATDGRPRCPECGRVVVKPRMTVSGSDNSGPDPDVWCSDMGHWAGRLSECRVPCLEPKGPVDEPVPER